MSYASSRVPSDKRLRGCLSVVLALSIALILVACSSQEPGHPNAAAPEIASVARRLRVLAEDSGSVTAFEKTKKAYEAATGVSVEIVRRDHVGVLTDLRGVPAQTYDLLIVPSRLLGELVERAYIQPIDVFLGDASSYEPRLFDSTKDIYPSWWSQLSWYQGRAYGYPFQLCPISLWYREDLFNDEDESEAFEKQFGRPLSFPRSASELEQVAAFFHRPQEGLFGTVLAGRSRSLALEWLKYAAMFGARMLDAPNADAYGEVVVNSPQAVRATQFFLGLLRFSPPESRRYDETDAVRAYEARHVAVGIMRHELAFASPEINVERKIGGIGYAPAPIGPDGSARPIEGDTFLIPRQSSQPRDAFAFMQWALSQDAQVAQILNGGSSTRLSSFDDDRVTTLPRKFPSLPFMQILLLPRLASQSVSMLTPTIPEADQLLEAMQPDLVQIVAGEVAPKAGLDRIAVRLGQVLKGKARLRYRPD
jgi:multiple sugar transport system substrate-binding protein